MSAMLMSEVLEFSLPPVPKFVLYLLADGINCDGEYWPKYGVLERKTGCSSDELYLALQWLGEAGLIRILRRGGAIGYRLSFGHSVGGEE
ncbi:helix-turn-helix domain-containing protein [Chromobacterium vaccinii]|uniref:helix-turn-helix domain-containing protein n=1 Tax=Chromobacterium vaccinii TaxID=1108595 RepID=UPI003458C7FD